MITPADLISRFGEKELKEIIKAADLSAPLDHNDPQLLTACQDASEIATSYLRRVYRLPLSPLPAVLIAYCADIARYRLHRDQPLDQKSLQRLRYEDAIRWLEDVAAGKISLLSADSEPIPLASPFPLHSGRRIAVVASPIHFDQATLEKMNGAKR